MKNKLYLLLGVLSVFSIGASAQMISTKAGIHVGGYSGNGGPANAAMLLAPASVALDATGNVYIADEYNNCIRKIATSGVITTIAGKDTAGFSGDGGQATDAKLNRPSCVAVDGVGNLYIADKYNDRIRKVNAGGIITTIAGTTRGFGGDGDTATKAKLNRPNCVAVDAAGNIFIADQFNNRIRKINTNGIITTILGNTWGGYNGDNFPIATMASLNGPNSVAISPKGDIYVADQYNYQIKKIDSNGMMYRIGGNMKFGYSGDGGNAKLAMLSLVKGIAVDPAGNVWLADWNNNRVRYITTTVDAKIVANDPKGFSVYPNPSQNGRFTVNITTANTEKITLVVTDLSGRVVYNAATETNKAIQLDLKQPTGMYIVTAISAETTWSERISIEQ